MRAPAAILAVPLVVGSAAGLLAYDGGPGWLCLTTAAAALVSLLAAVAAVADEDAPLAVAAMAVSAACAGVSLGTSAAAAAYSPPLQRWFDGAGTAARSSVSLTGILREDAAVTAAGVTLAIDVQTAGHEVTSGGVRLSVAGTLAGRSLHQWRAGRRLRLTASLRRPTVYRNPGVPDERRALARRGISLVGSVKSAALVEVAAPGGPVDEWAASLRASARRRLAATVGAWSQRSAGVATAILIGDRTGLSQDDERRLQDAGTYHVIAISGGNIAILTVLLLGLFRLGRVPPKWAAVTCIALLLFYGRVTGPAPSVDRAILAAVVFLSARVLELRGSSLNVLATAALCGVAVSPAAVLDPGFILSFGATLGILVGVSRLMASLDRGRLALRRVGRPAPVRWLVLSARTVIAVVAATVAAELVLAPAAAAMFGRVTAAGLILNLVAIPMMSVVQGGALAALAGAGVAPVATGCGYVVHRAASWLIDSSRLVEAAPWVARDVVPPAWWLLAAYYTSLLVAVLVAGRPNVRRAACLLAVVTGATIAAGTHATSRDGVPGPARGVLRIAILDVGQGDSTLVQFPDGRALLVDAGGLPVGGTSEIADGPSFDIGDRVVARAIRAFGVRKLDALVLTHGDPDHVGGAPAILRSFRPQTIWEGVPVPPHAALSTLAAAASVQKVEWRTTVVGDRIRLGDVEVETLHPPLPEWERQRVRNDDSIVLAIRYRDVQIVLPGDIGREGESAVATAARRSPLTILKAAHHGSATSTTPDFLSAITPNAVIFSAGRDNRFAHPAPAVVSRLRASGAQLFSTADDGAVVLETDGRSVQIHGWVSGRVLRLDSARIGESR